MREVRCKKCNRYLLKADSFVGQVKCPKCDTFNDIKFVSQTLLQNHGVLRTVKAQPGKDA